MEKALEGDEDEEQRLIEERRKRRQEILAKHQQDRELSGYTPRTTFSLSNYHMPSPESNSSSTCRASFVLIVFSSLPAGVISQR